MIQDALSFHAQWSENPNVKTAGMTNTISAVSRPRIAPGISRLVVLASSKAAMASNPLKTCVYSNSTRQRGSADFGRTLHPRALRATWPREAGSWPRIYAGFAKCWNDCTIPGLSRRSRTGPIRRKGKDTVSFDCCHELSSGTAVWIKQARSRSSQRAGHDKVTDLQASDRKIFDRGGL